MKSTKKKFFSLITIKPKILLKYISILFIFYNFASCSSANDYDYDNLRGHLQKLKKSTTQNTTQTELIKAQKELETVINILISVTESNFNAIRALGLRYLQNLLFHCY